MRARNLAIGAAAVLVLGACGSGDVPKPPGEAKVDVDTPALRAIKQQAGIETCTPGTATGGGLPSLTLPCLGGGPDVDLATLQGPLIVNLWQAYCGPCRQEMPALQEFYERHGDQVPVLGIDSTDVQPQAALEFAAKLGVTYPQLADPGNDLSARDPFPLIRGYPYLAIIDADGAIAYQQFGGVDSYADLVDLVDEHLGTHL
jgi:thiol-disulfide isomerase/thioredoxin